MKTRKHARVLATTTLLALLMSGAAATAVAQIPTKPSPSTPQHQQGMKDMKGMPAMSGMMRGPHHMLAMAYRDNLKTFAEVLSGHVAKATTVNLDLARPAVAEVRRSFDQMRQHHQAQVMMMSDHADSAMSAMKRHMETHLTALGEHLTALESEVAASTPDPKKVAEHTTEILKQHAGMAKPPAAAAPHKM